MLVKNVLTRDFVAISTALTNYTDRYNNIPAGIIIYLQVYIYRQVYFIFITTGIKYTCSYIFYTRRYKYMTVSDISYF